MPPPSDNTTNNNNPRTNQYSHVNRMTTPIHDGVMMGSNQREGGHQRGVYLATNTSHRQKHHQLLTIDSIGGVSTYDDDNTSTTSSLESPLATDPLIVPQKREISTYEIFKDYCLAIHFPNLTFENARSITITVMPLVAHALATGHYGTGSGGSSSSSGLNKPFSPISSYPSSVVNIISNNGTLFPPTIEGGAACSGCVDQYIGILYSVMSLGTVLANIPSGVLARHLPLHLVPTIAGFIYILTNSALILALYFGDYNTVYAALIVASFFLGMAFSPFSIGRLLFVQHAVPKEWYSRLMATVGGLQGWSMVSGPFIAGLAVEYLPGGVMAALGVNTPLMMVFIALVLLSKTLRRASDELEAEREVEYAEERRALRQQKQHHGGLHNTTTRNTRTYEDDEIEMKPFAATEEEHCIDNEVAALASPSLRRVQYFEAVALANVYGPFDDANFREESPVKPCSLLSEVWQNLYVVIVVGTFSFTMQMMRVNRTMLLSVQALRLGLAPSMVGTVLSISFFVDAALFLLGGYVGEKFGMRFQTAAASGCLGLSFIALSIPGATTDSVAFAQLIIAGVIFGFANSLSSGLLLALVATHAPKSKGNGVLTVMRSMQDAGPLVGSLGAGFLLRYVSFEYTCLLFGIVGLANALFGVVLIPKR